MAVRAVRKTATKVADLKIMNGNFADYTSKQNQISECNLFIFSCGVLAGIIIVICLVLFGVLFWQ